MDRTETRVVKAKNPKVRPIKPYGGQKLTRWVFGLAIADVVISAPALFSSFFQVYIIDQAVNGNPPNSGVAAISDGAQAVFGLAETAVYLPFFVLFVIWLRRMYRNLEYFGYSTRFQPGWAIGSFFVPLLNLVRPFQIVAEILDLGDRKQNPFKKSDLLLVTVWWIAFWASSLLGNLILRSALHADASLAELQTYSWNVVWADLIDCLLAPLFVLLIAKIRNKQERAVEEISAQLPREGGVSAEVSDLALDEPGKDS